MRNHSKPTIWILAANHKAGSFFTALSPTAGLTFSERLENSEAGVRERDLHRHQQGHMVSDTGRRTGLQAHGNARSLTASDLARRLAEHVEGLRLSGAIERLHLVAEPTMMGLIREHLSRPAAKLISSELVHDPAHDDGESLRRVLPHYL